MASERTAGTVDLTTTLRYQFRKSNLPYDVHEFTKIEIYDDYNKAEAGSPGDVLQTISSGSITKTSNTGKN